MMGYYIHNQLIEDSYSCNEVYMNININNEKIDSMAAGFTILDYQQLPWYSTLLDYTSSPVYFVNKSCTNIQIKTTNCSKTKLTGFIPVDSLMSQIIDSATSTENSSFTAYTSAAIKHIDDVYYGGITAIITSNDKPITYNLSLVSPSEFTLEDLEYLAVGLTAAKATALGFKTVDIYSGNTEINDILNKNAHHTPIKDFSRSLVKVSRIAHTSVNIHSINPDDNEQLDIAKSKAYVCLNTAIDYVCNSGIKLVDDATIKDIPKSVVNQTVLEYKNIYFNPNTLKPIKVLKSYNNPPNTKKKIGCQAATIATLLDSDPDTLNYKMQDYNFSESLLVNKHTNRNLLKLIKTGNGVKLNDNQIEYLVDLLCFNIEPPAWLKNKTGVLILAIIIVLDVDIKTSLKKLSQYDLDQLGIL